MINRYDTSATPCDHLPVHPSVNARVKDALQEHRVDLDPVNRPLRFREAQRALAGLASPLPYSGSRHESLEQFPSQLPRPRRLVEVPPTHPKRSVKPRYWRMTKDPFEGHGSEVSISLQHDPEVMANPCALLP